MNHTIYLKPVLSNNINIKLVDINGIELITNQTKKFKQTLKKAIREEKAVKVKISQAITTGHENNDFLIENITTTTQVPQDLKGAKGLPKNLIPIGEVTISAERQAVMNFLTTCNSIRPEVLKLSDLKWKYLMRSALRGKNIMMTGPAGCGKTMAAKSVVNALERPDFYFNLGATQDPRGTLIGNTHFNKDKGTYFSESLFIKAIQTKDAVILLDEISRAHPEAWNILMTVLDEGQRYLRIDEEDGSRTINVAEGVCFVATANIGNEYTATRVMDKALMDRFTIVEMDLLQEDEELALLKYLYPDANLQIMSDVCSISQATRSEMQTEAPRISSSISTRTVVEMAGLLYDGFSLQEAVGVTVYPQYDNSGGVDSERTFIKQIVQKYCDDGSGDDLFNTEDIDDNIQDNS